MGVLAYLSNRLLSFFNLVYHQVQTQVILGKGSVPIERALVKSVLVDIPLKQLVSLLHRHEPSWQTDALLSWLAFNERSVLEADCLGGVVDQT